MRVISFNNINLRNNKRDKKLEQGKEYTVKISSTNYPFMLGAQGIHNTTMSRGCRMGITEEDLDSQLNTQESPGLSTTSLATKVNSQLKKEGVYIVNGKKVLK